MSTIITHERGRKSIEDETYELLYSLVRCVKPLHVIESGAYPGHGTSAILNGLRKNGFGRLISYEPKHEYRVELRLKFDTSLLEVRPNDQYDERYCSDFSKADLAFIDSSGYGERNGEVEAWLDTAPSRSILVLHDIYDERWRKTERFRELSGLELRTPWGVGVYQR